jgi:CRP-like cAMP-binding protein
MLAEERFEPGAEIWRAGDPSGFLHILVEGTVACEVEPGRAFRAGPGYPLGNLESLARAPRWYRAVAETPVTTLRGGTDVYLDVLEDHFEMGMRVLSSMAAGMIRILDEKRRSEAAVPLPER